METNKRETVKMTSGIILYQYAQGEVMQFVSARVQISENHWEREEARTSVTIQGRRVQYANDGKTNHPRENRRTGRISEEDTRICNQKPKRK